MDFEQLYQANYLKVYSYVMTLTKEQSQAEEITQQTFFKALTSNAAYRGSSSEFTWLCSIAKNLVIDEARKQKRSCGLPEGAAASEDWYTQMEREDSVFRIHKALHGMEEPYKEVFHLRVFGELSFQKIGAIFGKTENWARVTYHRAKLKVQERMEDQ